MTINRRAENTIIRIANGDAYWVWAKSYPPIPSIFWIGKLISAAFLIMLCTICDIL